MELQSSSLVHACSLGVELNLRERSAPATRGSARWAAHPPNASGCRPRDAARGRNPDEVATAHGHVRLPVIGCQPRRTDNIL